MGSVIQAPRFEADGAMVIRPLHIFSKEVPQVLLVEKGQLLPTSKNGVDILDVIRHLARARHQASVIATSHTLGSTSSLVT